VEEAGRCVPSAGGHHCRGKGGRERSMMEGPGDYLKREREVRGVDLEEISRSTKISIKALQKLEANKFDDLPSYPFVKGFIRSYSKSLGIDGDDAALRFDAYLREKEESSLGDRRSAKRQEAAALAEATQGFSTLLDREQQSAMLAGAEGNALRPMKYILPLVFVVAVIAIALIVYYPSSRQTPAHESVVEKAEADHPASRQAPAQERVVEKTEADHPSSRQATAQKRVVAKTEPETPSPPPSPVVTPDESFIQLVPPESLVPSAMSAGEDEALPARDLTLKLMARKTTWMRVEIDDGAPFEVSLREGEVVEWHAAKGFSLFIGNAGGVEAIFNGKDLGQLGEEGEVVRINLSSPPAEMGN